MSILIAPNSLDFNAYSLLANNKQAKFYFLFYFKKVNLRFFWALVQACTSLYKL